MVTYKSEFVKQYKNVTKFIFLIYELSPNRTHFGALADCILGKTDSNPEKD